MYRISNSFKFLYHFTIPFVTHERGKFVTGDKAKCVYFILEVYSSFSRQIKIFEAFTLYTCNS